MKLFRATFNNGVVIVIATSEQEAFTKAKDYLKLKEVEEPIHNVVTHPHECVMYLFD